MQVLKKGHDGEMEEEEMEEEMEEERREEVHEKDEKMKLVKRVEEREHSMVLR